MNYFRNRIPKTRWGRSDSAIGVCYRQCAGSNGRHYHCPCPKCKFKVVPKMTEFRHWRKYNLPDSPYYVDVSDDSEISFQDHSTADSEISYSSEDLSDNTG